MRRIAEQLASLGYEPVLAAESTPGTIPWPRRRLYLQLGVAGFAFGHIMLFSIPRYASGVPVQDGFQALFDALNLLLVMPVLLFSASDYFRTAWHALRRGTMALEVPVALGLTVLFTRSLADIASGRGPGFIDSFARCSPTSRVPWFLPYHAGRLLTYELLALAAGLAGHVVALSGMGRALSVACGLMVLMAAAGKAPPPIARRITGPWSRALLRASLIVGHAVRTRPLMGQFAAGAVNGLLPCGLAYTAAVAAAALGGVSQSLIFMAGFGSGTLPALLVVSLSPASIPLAMRTRLRRVAPLALAVTGALVIMRGLVPPAHSGDSHMPFAAVAHTRHQP